uniref:Uncharacterized protein n=1 Tax=Neisseria meningitidis alpha275 TaxID=295996 RepID=C6SK97_NEIME|nr:hypothetical protein predicted by Glimmer/Critica [Neisseria meningitidis alpha275]
MPSERRLSLIRNPCRTRRKGFAAQIPVPRGQGRYARRPFDQNQTVHCGTLRPPTVARLFHKPPKAYLPRATKRAADTP